MKKNTILACAILMIMMVSLTGPRRILAANKNISGHLDSITGDSVSGWIWNSQTPEEALTVTITVTDASTGETAAMQTVYAEEYRDDLKAKNIGSGYYGFHAEVKWDTLPDASYIVSASSCGTTLPHTLLHTTGNVNLIPLGSFQTTAYCPCRICSEGWGRNTSSGAIAAANHTVAVDPRVIPMGSHLLIDGIEYVAEDIGGAVKGNHIDIYFNSHAETRRHGIRHSDVYLIQR